MGLDLSSLKTSVNMCSSCSNPLSNWYVEKAGRLYCRRDFWAKFGHLCNGCSVAISGPVMVAGEHRYHPECFQCCHCHCHVGEGEPYALVERSALFCGRCYHLRSTPGISRSISATSDPPLACVTSTGTTTIVTTSAESKPKLWRRRRPHTIQMLEIPPLLVDNDQHHQRQHRIKHHRKNEQQRKRLGSQRHTTPDNNNTPEPEPQPVSAAKGGTGKDELRPLQLSILESDRPSRRSLLKDAGFVGPHIAISKLEDLPELNCFEVGDRILEVEGSPVKEQSMQEVMHLLNNHSTSLHVMLERDLSPLRVPKEEGETVTSPSSSHPGTPDSGEASKIVMIQNTPVKLRSKASLKARGHSPTRRRSKSPSPCPVNRQKSMDLTRSHSFSTNKQDHRVFRAIDLIEEEILGQGFFGKAIKAKHRITGEHMVLKELHNFDNDAQKGFLREVSMLRNLSHPCVLKFMGVLYRDKKLTLVTEFVEGGTLTSVLLNHEIELSWLQRLNMIKDISAGMKYLHSVDIIHRDLNSNNCFVRHNQSVVVADFGLAKIVPRHECFKFATIEEDNKKTSGRKSKRFDRRKRQTVVGNPYWMAPEMITKGIYDEKVDVFSFGIIVCETLARVPADPDHMSRSIDLGVNVEAFYSRFCQNAPEAYVLLAALCAHIEPESRPSFEEIHILCEALHLHLEHGMVVPQELQGSPVQFYRDMKERLYGKGYRDIDSVAEAEQEKKETLKQKNENTKIANHSSNDGINKSFDTTNLKSDDVSYKEKTTYQQNSDGVVNCDTMVTCKENMNQALSSPVAHTDAKSDVPSSTNSNSTYTILSGSEKVNDSPQKDSNGTNHIEKAFAELTLDNLKVVSSSCGNTGAVNEDFAYFSCSSLSQSPSVSSLSLCAEDFNPCKTSPSCTSSAAMDHERGMNLDCINLTLESSHDLSYSSIDEPTKLLSSGSVSDSTISNILLLSSQTETEEVSHSVTSSSVDKSMTASSTSDHFGSEPYSQADSQVTSDTDFIHTDSGSGSQLSSGSSSTTASSSSSSSQSSLITLSKNNNNCTNSSQKTGKEQTTSSTILSAFQGNGSSSTVGVPHSQKLDLHNVSVQNSSLSPINDSHLSSSRRRKNKMKNLNC